jgi:hypothetical protein
MMGDNRCSSCKWWTHWREIALTDDEPQSIGHCVVLIPKGEYPLELVQGLTAHDFSCGAWRERDA